MTVAATSPVTHIKLLPEGFVVVCMQFLHVVTKFTDLHLTGQQVVSGSHLGILRVVFRIHFQLDLHTYMYIALSRHFPIMDLLLIL